jgi:type 1 glutamine amidotransferase
VNTLFIPKARLCFIALAIVLCICSISTAASASRFKVVVIAEFRTDDQHYPMVVAAKTWFAKLAADSTITVDWVVDPNNFTDAYLANYKVVIQMNYPPFAWNAASMAAFQKYIEQGKGGWIGLHHASLYSQNVLGAGQSLFTWFQPFLGGITYQNYMAGLAAATVRVEDTNNVCMKGVAKSFTVTNDEWYTWAPNPRANSNIHVIANVDQTTYSPKRGTDPTMPNNDHPVVWTNTSSTYKGRNIYIFMGHSADLFSNANWLTLVRNSVFWVAETGTKVKENPLSGTSRVTDLNIRTDSRYVSLNIPGAANLNATLTNVAGCVVAYAKGQNGACRIDRCRLIGGVYVCAVSYRTGSTSRRLLLD